MRRRRPFSAATSTEGVFLGKRSPQTFAKLQREQAKREKRELKQEKKAAAAEAKQAAAPGGEQPA